MAVAKDTVRITISIDKKVYEELERYSNEYGIPVAKAARNLLYSGLDDIRPLEKIGLLKVAVAIRNYKNFLIEKFGKK